MTADDLEHWQSRFEAILQDRPEDGDASHDIGHFRRVWRTSCEIADGEADERPNRLVLLAAAYLHDVVNPPKNSPERHLASRKSAETAWALLTNAGFPIDLIPAVAHAIEAHSFSAGITPETPEAKILQDADRLEALGAIGIARTFYVAGRLGVALFDPDDPFARDRPFNDRQFGLDHFWVKLLRIADTMQTAAGRALAEQRVARMRSFLADLACELHAGHN